MTKVYIAGPMRGIPEFNFPAFDRAEDILMDLGFTVFSPAARDRRAGFDETGLSGREDLPEGGPCSLRESLAADMEYITREADLLVTLPGWESSKGANAEVATALAIGLDVRPLSHFEDPPGNQSFTAQLSAMRADMDEVRVTSDTGGQKGQKSARLGSLPPKALLAVAEVAGFGEAKYSRLNYMKGYDWHLCFDAAQRHLLLWWSGEDTDPESGLSHLAHAAWHCLALLAFYRENIGTDTRWRP